MKPLGDLVLLERLDGDGREEIRPSGIILPARDTSLRHGNTKRIPDTFRARVVAVSDLAAKATEGQLAPGVEVLVHTYDQGQERTLAVEETKYGPMVSVEDIIGVVILPLPALLRDLYPADTAPPPTLPEGRVPTGRERASCKSHLPRRGPPESVNDLGFHTRKQVGE